MGSKAGTQDRINAVIDVLTRTGLGRWSVIADAIEEGVFPEPRLRKYAIAGLHDRDAYIANMIAEDVLPLYGKSIRPEIEATLNIKGGAYDAAERSRGTVVYY